MFSRERFSRWIFSGEVLVAFVLAIAALPGRAQVFSTPLNLSANPGNSLKPEIAVDGQGNINVVWTDTTPGNFDIFFSRSTDGVNFSAPLNLSANPGGFLSRPQIAVDGQGNINVVWEVVPPGTPPDIFFSRSTDGVNFSTPLNLSASLAFSSRPQIAVDGQGNINVVWDDFTPSPFNFEVFFSRSTDGVNFSAPVNLSVNPGGAFGPQIALEGQGNINVVWQHNTLGNTDIFFSRSTDGVNFSTLLNLSVNPGFSSEAQIAVDGQGNINVVWFDFTPGNFDIFFSRAQGEQVQVGPGPLAALFPRGLNFGSQPVSTTSAPKPVFLVNNGSAPLFIASIVTTTDFAQTSNCGFLPPKGFCVISVTFTPTAVGTRFGRVLIFDNAPGSPQSVFLVGRGQ